MAKAKTKKANDHKPAGQNPGGPIAKKILATHPILITDGPAWPDGPGFIGHRSYLRLGSVRNHTTTEGTWIPDARQPDNADEYELVAHDYRPGHPFWGDASEPLENLFSYFQSAREFFEARLAVQAIEERFMRMDAGLRSQCLNEPALLLHFLEDPANERAARILGFQIRPRPASSPPQPEEPEATTDAGQAEHA